MSPNLNKIETLLLSMIEFDRESAADLLRWANGEMARLYGHAVEQLYASPEKTD